MGKKRFLIMQGISSLRRSNILWFVYGVITSLIVVTFVLYRKEVQFSSQPPPTSAALDESSIAIPMQPFPEAPWRTPNTLEVRTVTSTPFARFEIHKVRTENGKIVNDWLWTDEREHVNILVHMKKGNKYMLFYQSKYGLTRKYYATVGGLFNKGDTPLTCAKRELLEETGLESEDMVYLGPYRVQVNRGGGILHAFLARNCYRSQAWKASDDYEKQERRFLTREELVNVTLSADIGEAQWLATVSTALLYEDYHATVMRNKTLTAH
ncbi:NUDIX hydrolase [archaeon]|nr:MAG: NUDIX hydrolase [archaeon]